jgi:hypothetical protein
MRIQPVSNVVLLATAFLFPCAAGVPFPLPAIGQGDQPAVRQDAGISVFQWRVGKERVRLIRADDGICFLSAVGGSFAGGGEWVRVRVDDGWWYLEGHCQQPLVWAEATCVRFHTLASAVDR